jgi:Na+-driven multidrug efflux pump
MKDFLIFVLFIVISAVLWIFATALVDGNGNTRYAFIGRSIFYWVAVISAFIFGYLI